MSTEIRRRENDATKSLRELLAERGLTQEQFAKLGGFSRSTVTRIMRGTRKLSQLELEGLIMQPKRRGPKPKQED